MTTFNYTGSEQTYTVPAGVSEVEITVEGAGMGAGGGRAIGRLIVTGGETLYVYVGEQPPALNQAAGGWNGGGTNTDGNGRGGHGASDVRQGGNSLSDRVIVGGGAGGDAGLSYGAGGYGGGANGGAGATSLNPGGGGTQSAGGSAGDGTASNGTLGVGGNSSTSYAGSGGGGYYGGGGGGYHGSGGGGSGYIGGVSSGSMTSGVNSGDGQVTIVIPAPPPTITNPGGGTWREGETQAIGWTEASPPEPGGYSVTYEGEYSLDGTFTDAVSLFSGVASGATSYDWYIGPDTVTADTATVKVRMRARNQYGVSVWSTSTALTIEQDLFPTVSMVSPTDMETVIDRTPTFTVDVADVDLGDLLHAEIEYAEIADFTGAVGGDTSVSIAYWEYSTDAGSTWDPYPAGGVGPGTANAGWANVISADSVADLHYRHDGFSSTIQDSYASPSTNPGGISWTGTNVISADFTADLHYLHAGFSGTISDSYSSPGTIPLGISWTGTDVISVDYSSDLHYLHSGFSSTIADSYASPSTEPTGISWDGSNVMSSDRVTDLHYLHDGFSATITSSYSSPGTSPQGITWDGANVISGDDTADLHYLHSGFSSTVSGSYASPSTLPRGITWDGRYQSPSARVRWTTTETLRYDTYYVHAKVTDGIATSDWTASVRFVIAPSIYQPIVVTIDGTEWDVEGLRITEQTGGDAGTIEFRLPTDLVRAAVNPPQHGDNMAVAVNITGTGRTWNGTVERISYSDAYVDIYVLQDDAYLARKLVTTDQASADIGQNLADIVTAFGAPLTGTQIDATAGVDAAITAQYKTLKEHFGDWTDKILYHLYVDTTGDIWWGDPANLDPPIDILREE